MSSLRLSLLALALVTCGRALDNGLGLTPPLAWSRLIRAHLTPLLTLAKVHVSPEMPSLLYCAPCPVSTDFDLALAAQLERARN